MLYHDTLKKTFHIFYIGQSTPVRGFDPHPRSHTCPAASLAPRHVGAGQRSTFVSILLFLHKLKLDAALPDVLTDAMYALGENIFLKNILTFKFKILNEFKFHIVDEGFNTRQSK